MLTFVKIPALTPNMSECFCKKWLYCFKYLFNFMICIFFHFMFTALKKCSVFLLVLQAGRQWPLWTDTKVMLFILFLCLLRPTPALPFGLILNEACSVSPGFRPNLDYIYSFYILASTLARGVGGVWEGQRIKTGGRWEEVIGREREGEKWETGKRRDETQIYGRGGSLN